MTVSVWRDGSGHGPVVEADVVVVGAGISGASVAWWLRGAGQSVVVIDRGDPAAGASGRNAGFLTSGSVAHFRRQADRFGFERALALRRMSQDNADLIARLIDQEGIACDFARRGNATLAADDAELGVLAQDAEELRQGGFEVSILDAGATRRELGVEGFAGAVLCHGDGEVHPVRLTRGVLERSGAAVHGGHEVHGFHEDGSEVHVWTDRGRFVGRALVLATNGYTADLLGAAAPRIEPLRGQALATGPAPHRIGMPCYLPTAFAYFRQRPDGRVVVGGMRTRDERGEVGTADTLHPGIQDALGELVERHMPWARGARIDHRWSGTLGYSTDGLPVVGPVAGMSRVFVLGGYGGHGMGWAFKCAQLLTRRMRDGEPVPHLDTSRFASS